MHRILVHLLALLTLCAASGQTQQQNTTADTTTAKRVLDSLRFRDFRVVGPGQQQTLTETDRRIAVARSLMHQRNFEGAASMLEVILETEPNNGVVQNLLLSCYQELNHPIQAEALLRTLLQSDPDNFYFQMTLAEMLAAQDKKDEALTAYDRAATLVQGWQDPRVPVLIRSELNSGIVDHALDYINRARRETGDSTLFALETGQLLERQGHYKKAVREYFPLLAQDTTRAASDAEKRLFEMLSFVGSAEATENALLHISQGETNPRALRLLSTHFIQSGEFDKAYSFTLRQDSVEQGQGAALLYYVRQCLERQQYDQACRMAERAITRYDRTSPVYVDVLFHYADALSRAGRPDSAIVLLNRVMMATPNDNDKGEALYRIGLIYAEELDQCDRALVYFDSVATHYRRGIGYLNARLQIPRCQIRLGDLDNAAATYQSLKESRLTPEMSEEVDYQLAMIRLYQRQFDSAQVALRKVIVDYPRGFYVNDALRLVMILNEVKDNQPVKSDYAEALYFRARQMPDSSRVRYQRLAGGDALADIALLQLADMDLAECDSTAAMESLDNMIQRFPDSYYYPFGLKNKADLLMADTDSVDAAMELYKKLLADFPNYPFISEVRQRVRQHEQQRVG